MPKAVNNFHFPSVRKVLKVLNWLCPLKTQAHDPGHEYRKTTASEVWKDGQVHNSNAFECINKKLAR